MDAQNSNAPHNCSCQRYDSKNRVLDSFKAGEYLFKNGSPNHGAFCVCQGLIELLYKNDEGFFFKVIKSAGDIIGADDLNVHYYIFDARALEDSVLCFFDKRLKRQAQSGLGVYSSRRKS